MVRFDEKNRAFMPVPEIDLRAHRKLIYEPDFSRQITLQNNKLSQFVYFSLILREREETKTKYSAPYMKLFYIKLMIKKQYY